MNGQKRAPAQPMYVYDRICPREAKRREILREYGTAPKRQRYDRNSPDEPIRRRTDSEQHSCNRSDNAHQYRPGKVQGGEAVKERPLKLLIDRFVNLFVSVEERGRQDETIARRQAVAWKKLVEHRWTILITLILIAVAALFVLAVFRFVFVIREVEVTGDNLYTAGEIIEAAGVSEGENLYSFDALSSEAQITFCLPMIRTAQIDRTIPTSVDITVTEDEPAFLCNIWGETLVLSAGLRVLGSASGESTLPVLVLPPVDYSVAGRVLSFADERDERYIRSVLADVLASAMWSGGMITGLDLSDEYDLEVNVAHMYIFRLGSEDDCAHKLKLGYKTITNGAFTRNVPARIDIRDPEKAAVNYDPALVVD